MEEIKKGVLGAVLLLALMLFYVTVSFATDHYIINTSSIVVNQTYENYSQQTGHGGVFYIGENGNLTINSSQFYNNSVSTVSAYGGAVYNTGSLFVYDSEFSSNTAGNSGAISNLEMGILKIGDNVKFSFNKAESDSGSGGAIGNYSNMATVTIGDNVSFISNSAELFGGAIENMGNIKIGENVLFSSNTVTSGDYGGGAIYNEGDKITIGSGAHFGYNSAKNGGAIFNPFEGTIQIGDDAEFISNTATNIGGAIVSSGTSKTIIGDNAKFISNSSRDTGGAIVNFNTSVMEIGENALFFSNKAVFAGGAINNLGEITIKSGTKFIDNEVQAMNGGAIWNGGTLNLVAETGDIEFSGNIKEFYATITKNAIHDNKGTINIWTSDIANIIFNDGITSQDDTSVLNINQSSGTLSTSGTVILNDNMTGYTGQVNLYNGTIALGENGTLFGGKIYVDNATIDFANSIIKEHNFKDLTVNNKLNLIVNADLENEKMDTIYADSFSGAGKINVKKINILTDTPDTAEILFTSSTVLQGKITTTPTASSALYIYDVVFDDKTGTFYFTNAGGIINPAIVSGAVASAAGGFTTQKAIIDQSFASLNNFVSKKVQTKAKTNRNLYASATNKVFESENKIERGLWIRPYASQDTVKIGDADIDNTLYGTLAGIDLPVSEDKQVSFYIGYAGSKQDIEEIKVTQTGYIVGATGMLIKDKWYAGLTANINFNKAESDNDFGTDEFDMNMYAIAAKAGYDIEAGKNWTIEPNIMLIYGSVNRQEYTTKQGAKIKGASDNNIIVAPQVKAKLDLDKGLKPYALLGYVLNAGDKIKAEADGLDSEADKADGYVEYGIGLNKDFINTPWSCYVQVTGKGGDRSGFDGSFGVKYNF